jgi:hypothetical protein
LKESPFDGKARKDEKDIRDTKDENSKTLNPDP